MFGFIADLCSPSEKSVLSAQGDIQVDSVFPALSLRGCGSVLQPAALGEVGGALQASAPTRAPFMDWGKRVPSSDGATTTLKGRNKVGAFRIFCRTTVVNTGWCL